MWNCGCVLSDKALKEIPSSTCLMCSSPITLKIHLNQSKEEQKSNKISLGVKRVKKTSEPEIMKKAKLVDMVEIEKTHQASLSSEVYKSLFSTTEASETFCCRHLRAGLR
ncbi:hypothetical protein SteCoe_10054 [Stentor coeruleus]|uniref:Uncharacterized protein n=1 Tax=Stentor coeruleus TaxID=5963 RepID=A0A1R2CGC2_9CILI|nr:hypothetical protein SteCoe_10054 [Stentor coeruleus]